MSMGAPLVSSLCCAVDRLLFCVAALIKYLGAHDMMMMMDSSQSTVSPLLALWPVVPALFNSNILTGTVLPTVLHHPYIILFYFTYMSHTNCYNIMHDHSPKRIDVKINMF
jgi:hypothetical protein